MRKFFLALVGVLTLGTIASAQLIPPGVNSPFNLVWTAMWESSTLKPTYYATSQPFAAASSARVVFTINGSATKTVRVRRFIISGIAAAPIAEPIYVNKTSGATITSGTSVLLTKVPLDSTQSAATAYVENFTANPTDPTLVGEVLAPYVRFFSGNTAVDLPPTVIEMGKFGSAAILRSATEQLALNLAHVTTGATITVGVEWTEE